MGTNKKITASKQASRHHPWWWLGAIFAQPQNDCCHFCPELTIVFCCRSWKSVFWKARRCSILAAALDPCFLFGLDLCFFFLKTTPTTCMHGSGIPCQPDIKSGSPNGWTYSIRTNGFFPHPASKYFLISPGADNSFLFEKLMMAFAFIPFSKCICGSRLYKNTLLYHLLFSAWLRRSRSRSKMCY